MLEIGSLVDGKYKILSEIGHGGMSVVYMAINEKANKTWAVKEVRKNGVLDFESVRQGLIVEIDMLKKLNHPGLPSIIDVIENEESLLIVMDYIQGNSLNTALAESGAQSQENVIEWAKQLCDVLGYLHTRKPAIIYRDMKPANIMLKPDGKITLIDFGTAREFKQTNNSDTRCLGTIGYAAPEQFGGMGQTDARTDIYCLGATLYHLVSGLNPCEEPYEIKPIREVNPTLSSGLERIIIKCTQRNPQDRYQSVEELKYDLDHYAEIDHIYRRKQKKRLFVFFLTLAFSIFFVVMGVMLRQKAASMAQDSYDDLIYQASITTDNDEKLELYKRCINVTDMAGQEDAYFGIMQIYKEDSVFSEAEAKSITTLIMNNKTALLKKPENYRDVCFELGKLYWYYSEIPGEDNSAEYIRSQRARNAETWFSQVLENSDSTYEGYGMTDAYRQIGLFYKNIANYINEGNDKGQYREMYTGITSLLKSVALNENEPEMVRLELMRTIYDLINNYSAKYKTDGVDKNTILGDIETIFNEVEKMQISTELTQEKADSILEMHDALVETITNAYDAN